VAIAVLQVRQAFIDEVVNRSKEVQKLMAAQKDPDPRKERQQQAQKAKKIPMMQAAESLEGENEEVRQGKGQGDGDGDGEEDLESDVDIDGAAAGDMETSTPEGSGMSYPSNTEEEEKVLEMWRCVNRLLASTNMPALVGGGGSRTRDWRHRKSMFCLKLCFYVHAVLHPMGKHAALCTQRISMDGVIFEGK
jgi:hypothetical protein